MLLLGAVVGRSSITLRTTAGIPSHPNVKFRSEDKAAVKLYEFKCVSGWVHDHKEETVEMWSP